MTIYQGFHGNDLKEYRIKRQVAHPNQRHAYSSGCHRDVTFIPYNYVGRSVVSLTYIKLQCTFTIYQMRILMNNI